MISLFINSAIGISTLFASFRFLFAKTFFSYHAQASGIAWNLVDDKLKLVILAILKVGGTGCCILSLLILAASARFFFQDDLFMRLLLACLIFLYWGGVFLITYNVYKKTKARTPWLFSILTSLSGLLSFFIYLLERRS